MATGRRLRDAGPWPESDPAACAESTNTETERPVVVNHERPSGQAAAQGVTIYAPVPNRRAGPADSPAVTAWRARMATDDAKVIYKARAATAEWINPLYS